MAKFGSHVINEEAYVYLEYLVKLSNIDNIASSTGGFLNPTNYGNASTVSELANFFKDGSLPPEISANKLINSPKKALTLQELDASKKRGADSWSIYAANIGITRLLHGIDDPISELSKENLELINQLFGMAAVGDSQAYAREWFVENHAYLESAYAGQNLDGRGQREEQPTVKVAAEALYHRLIIWKDNFVATKSKEENLRVITAAELVKLNDMVGGSSAEDSAESLNYLEEVFKKVYGKEDWEFRWKGLKQIASPNGSTSETSWLGFYMAFKPLDGNLPSIDPNGRNS